MSLEPAQIGLVFLDHEGIVTSMDAISRSALGVSGSHQRVHISTILPAGIDWRQLAAQVQAGSPSSDIVASTCGKWHATLRAAPHEHGSPGAFVLVVTVRTTKVSSGLFRDELMLRVTHEAIWEMNCVTHDVWWNDQQYTILGYAPGAVKPSFEAWFKHVHPEDQTRVESSFLALIESTETMWRDSYRFVRVDGSVREAMDGAVVERDEHGRALRIVGAMNDVTEGRHLERALSDSEERFRQITDTIRDVFWLAEPGATRILYVSPAWEAMWGRSRESVLADASVFFESIHPEDRPRVLAAVREQVDLFDETFRIVRPDGRIVWVHDRGYPIYDHAGRLVRMAGVVSDVSAEREVEQRLKRANRLESIGQLAGGIAHDFNNMLNVMFLNTDLALEALALDHPARPYLMGLYGAAERAANLTRQLLIFARQQAVHPFPVDLNRLVVNTASMLKTLLGEQVELVVRTGPEANITVVVDPGQLEQVIVNLAVNARDAMPKGGTFALETTTTLLDGSGQQGEWYGAYGPFAVLSVSDTGLGMPEEVLAHAFEPFFTTKGPEHGTGLGLAICYGVVTKVGGQIRVTSKPGCGTRFDILLPRSELAARELRESSPATPRGGKETILLVEDQSELRLIVGEVLRSAGYEVLTAADGLEALAAADNHNGTIDLLVTDVAMPRMNGLELAQQLRGRSAVRRVLYMSGEIHGSQLDSLPDRESRFLAKPYVTSTLLREVRTLLETPPRPATQKQA